jgi:hypothetical protein
MMLFLPVQLRDRAFCFRRSVHRRDSASSGRAETSGPRAPGSIWDILSLYFLTPKNRGA